MTSVASQFSQMLNTKKKDSQFSATQIPTKERSSSLPSKAIKGKIQNKKKETESKHKQLRPLESFHFKRAMISVLCNTNSEKRNSSLPSKDNKGKFKTKKD